MELKKVESSQIDSIGWENDILVVKFNGGAVYAYSNVPYTTYSNLLASESKGHFLNESIKNRFSFTKLTD